MGHARDAWSPSVATTKMVLQGVSGPDNKIMSVMYGAVMLKVNSCSHKSCGVQGLAGDGRWRSSELWSHP